jgi:RHS repeat-associated protein
MAGRTRLARLGGKEPVQVAAGFLAPVPPALTALAASLLALALLFGLARAQVPARSAAALGSVCSLLALTTSGCNCGHSASTVAPIPATHYHGDHLGGTTVLTAQDGSVASEIAYDPFGAEIVGATEPYAFTGKEYEPDTGLYDFAARAYDPVLARFLSRDPASLANPAIGIGDPQILNPYAYARNSPATYVDRDGREPNVAGDEAGVNEILRDRQFQATGAKETLEQAKPIAEGALQATPVGGAYVAATGQRLTGGEATRAERAFGAATAFGGVILKGLKTAGQAIGEWRAARGPIWSTTKGKSAVENAFGHWKKHGTEFPEFRNAKEYVEGAQRFVNQPSQGGVLSKVRANGDTVLYDSASNTFGVRAADGAPRTMFRPDPAQHGYPTNLDYFNAQ